MHKLTIWTKNGCESIVVCEEHLEECFMVKARLGYTRISITEVYEEDAQCKLCGAEKTKVT